jgi:hypothetical protein
MKPFEKVILSAWVRRSAPISDDYHPTKGHRIYRRWKSLIDFTFSSEGRRRWPPQQPTFQC